MMSRYPVVPNTAAPQQGDKEETPQFLHVRGSRAYLSRALGRVPGNAFAVFAAVAVLTRRARCRRAIPALSCIFYFDVR